MFPCFAALLALLIGHCSWNSVEGATPRKPNVIVILTDDQGYGDVGCYGARDIETPHIDALAKRGVRFTRFYAAAPVCSPSRAALLTGKRPWRAGVPGNVSHEANGKGLPSKEVTIAETLKAKGYATAHIGKWHLGTGSGSKPNDQGFDHSFGHMSGCIDNYSHFFYWAGPNKHDLYRNGKEVFHNGEFFLDLQLKEAKQFITANREGPFFIYYAVNAPHYPYQGEPKWIERYRDLPYPRNLYAAFVSTMDERIGGLLKHLDDSELRENTIVIFQSDHGHSVEERAHHGGGSPGHFRGAKFSLFEGGLRVPAIVSWPGTLPEGVMREQLANGCDWLPTIAELCGVEVVNRDLDGKSLAGLLKNENTVTPHASLEWMTGDLRNPEWAVLKGDWKLLGNVRAVGPDKMSAKDKELFLVNLHEDPSETVNLRDSSPEILKELLGVRSKELKGLQP